MSHLNKSQELKSVGIIGDGDDVQLIEDLESAFKITFSDEEAESIFTLGEAFEVVCSKLPSSQKLQNKCLTAMAYYRLNKAFCGHGKIKLSTRVEVPVDLSPRSFQRQLEEMTNLKLDFLTKASLWVVILSLLQFVTWIVAPIMFSGFIAILVGILVVAVSHTLWRFADSIDERVWVFDGTLGDLSRQASEVNLGQLVSLGGRWTESDVWKTMTTIIHDLTGFPPENMTPETKFI
ncbi:acyl carrier protein [Pelagibius sp. Alg239-R121]|uniref:acyl carrier protein n=1 Tax=Pelagibius sp. Alg239-R121 TaxID=2993448 RepID=UPI0024A6F5E6|nr:acyl carrier protein [Pelagibius sp. Alg239-R121]